MKTAITFNVGDRVTFVTPTGRKHNGRVEAIQEDGKITIFYQTTDDAGRRYGYRVTIPADLAWETGKFPRPK